LLDHAWPETAAPAMLRGTQAQVNARSGSA
jgi:hypothetical protein